MLDKYGFTEAESILNEWNYVRSFTGEPWLYSLRMEKSLKGAAFISSVMCDSQVGSVDLLMYYDARPCGMNGLFASGTYVPLKPYYAFVMFRELAALGTQIPVPYCTEDIYSCAATDGKNAAVMLSYYTDDDSAADKDVRLAFTHADGAKKVTCRVLDAEHDLVPVREEIFTADTFALQLHMPLHSSVMIQIESL